MLFLLELIAFSFILMKQKELFHPTAQWASASRTPRRPDFSSWVKLPSLHPVCTELPFIDTAWKKKKIKWCEAVNPPLYSPSWGVWLSHELCSVNRRPYGSQAAGVGAKIKRRQEKEHPWENGWLKIQPLCTSPRSLCHFDLIGTQQSQPSSSWASLTSMASDC